MATKLLIGNIESNPFPSGLREFLGFLFTDAEDTNIKDVLNDFKAANDRPTNLKKMKSKKVEHLKSTLAYLNDWSKDDSLIKEEIDAYTKDGITLLVVNNVYNMAPEKCSSMKPIRSEEDVENLQSDLDMIYDWQKENNMLFNSKKFEMLRYGSKEELKISTNYL